jgi:hypothetical protein
MYGLKLQNGAIVGVMTLAKACKKFKQCAVVTAVVRLSDKKEIVR